MHVAQANPFCRCSHACIQYIPSRPLYARIGSVSNECVDQLLRKKLSLFARHCLGDRNQSAQKPPRLFLLSICLARCFQRRTTDACVARQEDCVNPALQTPMCSELLDPKLEPNRLVPKWLEPKWLEPEWLEPKWLRRLQRRLMKPGAIESPR